MANTNEGILSLLEEQRLRKPIENYVGAIQKKIDALRADGTNKVIELQSSIEAAKRDKSISHDEKAQEIAGYQSGIKKAKEVEAANKAEVESLSLIHI